MEQAVNVAHYAFQWAFIVLIDAPFAVFAYKWYAKNRTRGHLLFFVGWVLATAWGVINKTIVPMYFLPTLPKSASDISDEVATHWNAVQGVLTSVGSTTYLIIGIGFLLVVFAAVREQRRTTAN